MDHLTYQRRIPIESGFDLVVVGGGPSGVAAATAAGRMGCKVALIEQTGCLGGLGTSGMVNVLMPFSDGQHTLMGGIGAELVQSLYDRGFVPSTISTDIWRKGR